MENALQAMLEWFDALLLDAGAWLRGYVSQLALAFVATLLVIYGSDINRTVKGAVRTWPRIMRLLAFVVMCVFGYGALTVLITPWIARGLSQVDTFWLAPVVIGGFLLLGWLAERKNQI
ncbi:DUF3392 domain-containing protein [Ectothiorhodospira mobilis]|uniref:DUF3392 domain-containing protein n=1 Tax=Ectothiorhodospira mobilis TaxID=195064 RepID=A0A1I4QQH6_ECTMO|nr:DUF3392 domain-containing protein [Ectothiorhodospira mobilis]MCG5535898.1 DUF3392 domain-containing protein [Ectothiorhodospira mobilis]SFM41960.1 Protein of unknown function [Ectothiorhodospira mobilis]